MLHFQFWQFSQMGWPLARPRNSRFGYSWAGFRVATHGTVEARAGHKWSCQEQAKGPITFETRFQTIPWRVPDDCAYLIAMKLIIIRSNRRREGGLVYRSHLSSCRNALHCLPATPSKATRLRRIVGGTYRRAPRHDSPPPNLRDDDVVRPRAP